ncbi:MAG: hypothetical protein AAGJ38_00445 [Planctomycetota bacterium]
MPNNDTFMGAEVVDDVLTLVPVTTASSTSSDPFRFLTATTRVGPLASNSGLFQSSLFTIGDNDVNPANFVTVNGGTNFTRYNKLGQNANPERLGVLIYDFDMSQADAYENLELNLALAQGRFDAGTGSRIFLSYNDAEANLQLNESLAVGFGFSAFAIENALTGETLAPEDPQQFVEITTGVVQTPVLQDDFTTLNSTNPTQVLSGFGLDGIRDAMDDDTLRLAISVDGFNRNLTVLSGGVDNLLSAITGTLASTGGVPGDYDDSGLVEQSDLNLVLSNWGQPAPFTPNGEAFATANVDQEELNRVLTNWGSTSVPPSFEGSSIPEPAFLSVLSAASLVLGRRTAA